MSFDHQLAFNVAIFNLTRKRSRKHKKSHTPNAKAVRLSPTPTPLPSMLQAKNNVSNAKDKMTNAQAKRPTSKVKRPTPQMDDEQMPKRQDEKHCQQKTTSASRKYKPRRQRPKPICHVHANISTVKEGPNTQSHLLTRPNSNDKNKNDSERAPKQMLHNLIEN